MFDSLLYLPTLLLTLILCLLVQGLCWWFQYKTKNTDIVDIGWSSLIVICGLIYFFESGTNSFHCYIILFLPVAWYIRLSWHLIVRYDHREEDGRYQQLRKHWTTTSANLMQLKMFGLFMFQGLLAWGFSIPAYTIAQINSTASLWDSLGILIAIIAFIGVTIADKQLLNFKQIKANKGLVCSDGLWLYSRHPNYFFEWLHWFSYPLLALNSNSLTDPNWWLLVSYPLWMLLFLLKFTGIPFNEEQNLRSKGKAYKEYQKSTNKFFLGIPTK